MLHRKIVEPVLAGLEDEASAYFGRVLQRLETDPRLEPLANLVYLCLRETIPYLPVYLPADDLVETLFGFVGDNRKRLNLAIFDRSYIEGPDGPERLKLVTNEFVALILEMTLDRYDDGEINDEGEGKKVYRFSSDGDAVDFPYKGFDSDDD